MERYEEYAGYSFDSEDNFEWSTRHKIHSIMNSIATLKEECIAEAQITPNHRLMDLLETSGRILEVLEHSFEDKMQDEGIIYSPKSAEPWD